MGSHFYLYRDIRAQWRWSYVASNGRTIAVSSESYWNKADAVNGIALMKASYPAPIREG